MHPTVQMGTEHCIHKRASKREKGKSTTYTTETTSHPPSSTEELGSGLLEDESRLLHLLRGGRGEGEAEEALVVVGKGVGGSGSVFAKLLKHEEERGGDRG
jgi:hypothetical protein